MGTSLNTAPQLLSAFTLGEDVRVKQAFLAENGYVLLLREDNSERLVLLGDDAIFYSSLQELACRLFSRTRQRTGGLSLILYDAPNQGYRLVSLGANIL